MFKNLKTHIFIFLILGFLLYVPRYVNNTPNFDLVYLITQLFITYLIYSSITILVGLTTYLVSKNLDKTINYIKKTLVFTIVFMGILVIGDIYIYFKYL
jgi:hypothetical protein